MKLLRWLGWAVAWLIALGCGAWAFGALHYDFPVGKSAVPWAFAIAVIAAVVFLHGAWRKLAAVFAAFALVLAWWLTLRPSNDGDWQPAVQLKTDADAAFQTIRYGWSAGTPLAVLTDFEQLHILDCRARPDIATALARSHRFFHWKRSARAES